MKKLINQLNSNFEKYYYNDPFIQYEEVKNDYELTTYKDEDGNTRLKLLILGGLLYEYIGMDDEVVQEIFHLKGFHFEHHTLTQWILVKD